MPPIKNCPDGPKASSEAAEPLQRLQKELQEKHIALAKKIEEIGGLEGQISCLEEELSQEADIGELEDDLNTHTALIKALANTSVRRAQRTKGLENLHNFSEHSAKHPKALKGEKRELEQHIATLRRMHNRLKTMRKEHSTALCERTELEGQITTIKAEVEKLKPVITPFASVKDGTRVQIHQSVPQAVPLPKASSVQIPPAQPIKKETAEVSKQVESVATFPPAVPTSTTPLTGTEPSSSAPEKPATLDKELENIKVQLREQHRRKASLRKSIREDRRELDNLRIAQISLQKKSMRNPEEEEEDLRQLTKIDREIRDLEHRLDEQLKEVERIPAEIEQIKSKRDRLKEQKNGTAPAVPASATPSPPTAEPIGPQITESEHHRLRLVSGGLKSPKEPIQVPARTVVPQEAVPSEPQAEAFPSSFASISPASVNPEKPTNTVPLVRLDLGQGLSAILPTESILETLNNISGYRDYLRTRIYAVLKALPDPDKLIVASGQRETGVKMPIDLELNLKHEDLRAKQLAAFNTASSALGIEVPKAVTVRDTYWEIVGKKGEGVMSVKPHFTYPPTPEQHREFLEIRQQLQKCLRFLSEEPVQDVDNPAAKATAQRQQILADNIQKRQEGITALEAELQPLLSKRDKAVAELRKIITAGQMNSSVYSQKSQELIELKTQIEAKEKELKALRASLTSLEDALGKLSGGPQEGLAATGQQLAAAPLPVPVQQASAPATSSAAEQVASTPPEALSVSVLQISEQLSLTLPSFETIKSWLPEEPQLCRYLYIRLRAYLLALPDPEKLRDQKLWAERSGSFLLDFLGDRDCLSVGHRKLFKAALKPKGINIPPPTKIRDEWWQKKNPEYYQGLKPKFDPRDPETLSKLHQLRIIIQAYIDFLASLDLPAAVCNIQPGSKKAGTVLPVVPAQQVLGPTEEVAAAEGSVVVPAANFDQTDESTEDSESTTVPTEYQTIHSNLPGFDGVVIPSVRALKEKLQSVKDKRGIELLIKYLEGYLQALPQLENPEKAIRGFKGTAFAQIASSSSFSEICEQLKFNLPVQQSPTGLFRAWFNRCQQEGKKVIKLRDPENINTYQQELQTIRQALQLRLKLLRGERIPRPPRVPIASDSSIAVTSAIPSIMPEARDPAETDSPVSSIENNPENTPTASPETTPVPAPIETANSAALVQQLLRQPEVADKAQALLGVIVQALLAEAESIATAKKAQILASAEAEAAAAIRKREAAEGELASIQEQIRKLREGLNGLLSPGESKKS